VNSTPQFLSGVIWMATITTQQRQNALGMYVFHNVTQGLIFPNGYNFSRKAVRAHIHMNFFHILMSKNPSAKYGM
jgi:hypothetical protein